ncbi:oxysterol-binding protein 1-like isoform X1 [Artemia franciscana]|uniref:oxysterol-binding protein 1-like isoform X1 n=1 Tax=Artemia franciscana TaxID=6661 RepID=UPI0032DAEFE1
MAEFKPANTGSSVDMKGYLHKWTNYFKGYQKRWFVLSNGVLSYYRYHSEMSHTFRSSIRLQGAIIHADESCKFSLSNSRSNTFHLKAANEAERQKWITAIELAKSKVIRQQDLEDEEEYDNNAGDSWDNKNIDEMIKSLTSKFNGVQTCTELLTRHYTALTKAIADTESTISTALEKPQEVTAKIKALNERSELFRLTSGEVLRAATDFLHLVEKDGKRWLKEMTYEYEQRGRLQQMVEQLARQHSSLEQAAKFRVSKLPNSSTGTFAHSDDDEGEFNDIQDENEFLVPFSPTGARRSSSGSSFTSLSSEGRGAGVENEEESSSDHEEGDATISVIPRRNKSPIASEGRGTGVENKGESSSDYEEGDATISVIPRRNKSPIASEGRGTGVENEEESSSDYEEGDATISVIPRRNKSPIAAAEDVDVSNGTVAPATSSSAIPAAKKRQRRTRIPDKPYLRIMPWNLWTILKNYIGKELTEIPIPFNFCEPLSMLQRLVEDYEYSEILDKAAMASDSCEQLAYVAAFTVSSYATTSNRTAKPFNPLLGETYELDRTDDLGWKCISEQVW